jgi:SAM-dependent methyltransferase
MNFDPVARSYQWMEYLTFGPLLERCRFAHLGQLGSPRRALVLGDGDGRFVVRLLARYPELVADVVELSPAMVRLAQQRAESIGVHGRAHFYIADARGFPPPSTRYDLIATHFFLDCLDTEEVAALISNLADNIEPDATWLVSEFAVPTKQPLRWIAEILVGALYLAFRLLTGLQVHRLPDYFTVFRQGGYQCAGVKTYLGGILRSETWQATRTGQHIAPGDPHN